MGGYEHHPLFTRPPGESHIWRYIGLAPLIDMLDRESLYFARADRMVDPWEGWIPPLSEDAHMAEIGQSIDRLREMQQSLNTHGFLAGARQSSREFRAKMRERTFLSCWYVSPYESAAMWDLYA